MITVIIKYPLGYKNKLVNSFLIVYISLIIHKKSKTIYLKPKQFSFSFE